MPSWKKWPVNGLEGQALRVGGTLRDRMPTMTMSGMAVAGGVAAVTYWAIKTRKKKG